MIYDSLRDCVRMGGWSSSGVGLPQDSCSFGGRPGPRETVWTAVAGSLSIESNPVPSTNIIRNSTCDIAASEKEKRCKLPWQVGDV